MNENEIHPRVREFVLEKFPQAKKRNLKDDLMLLESGIIDSLGVLDVVQFLEEAFSIKIDDEDLTPENFATLQTIVSFVEHKRVELRPAVG
jgi:acyl carrier protein